MGLPDDSASIPTAPEAPEIIDAERPLRPSQLIGGRYDVRARLGAGRSGTVYRVHDCVLAEDVALKLLRPELVENSRALEGVRREVKLARKIAHPNVRRVFDIGEQDGLAFITMELVVGETLRAFIARGAGSVSARVHLFEQVARGLAAMHAEGILHRDVRVENILVREDGTAVISDFGFALESADESQRGNTFVYAPLYGSHEQLRGEPLDARSDVFALGLVGYEILTGNRPFGEDAMTIATSVILRDATAYLKMEEVSRQVAIDLGDLLLRTLAKGPADRPTSSSCVETLVVLREAILLAPASASAAKTSAGTAVSSQWKIVAPRARVSRIGLVLGMSALATVAASYISFNTKPLLPLAPDINPFAAYPDVPPEPTDQQLFDRYLPIWKRLFLETNAMSATEFTRRITAIKPSIVSWDSGVSLNVEYDVATNWAKATRTQDSILIYLYETENANKFLPVPCKVFLQEADVALAMLRRNKSERIHQVPFEAKLKYLRPEDAEMSLRALTNECVIKSTGITLGETFPGNLSETSLDKLEMKGGCTIDDRWNRCGKGKINLITGDGEFKYAPCHIW